MKNLYGKLIIAVLLFTACWPVMAAEQNPGQPVAAERVAVQCAICHEDVHEPYSLECVHTFCIGCLHAWVQQHNGSSCPSCRHPIMENVRGQLDAAIEGAIEARNNRKICDRIMIWGSNNPGKFLVGGVVGFLTVFLALCNSIKLAVELYHQPHIQQIQQPINPQSACKASFYCEPKKEFFADFAQPLPAEFTVLKERAFANHEKECTGQSQLNSRHLIDITYMELFPVDNKPKRCALLQQKPWVLKKTLYDRAANSLCLLSRDYAYLKYFSIAFVRNNPQIILTNVNDNYSSIWNTQNGALVRTINRQHNFATTGFPVFSPDDRLMLAMSPEDGSVALWDTQTGKLVQTLQESENKCAAATFNTDGTQIATAACDGTAQIWELSSSSELKRVMREKAAALAKNKVTFKPQTTTIEE